MHSSCIHGLGCLGASGASLSLLPSASIGEYRGSGWRTLDPADTLVARLVGWVLSSSLYCRLVDAKAPVYLTDEAAWGREIGSARAALAGMKMKRWRL